MAAKHIQIAQEQGAKAGFNFFVPMLERSGLPQTQVLLAEMRATGNKKAQFDWYCNKFGAKFGQAVQASVKPVVNDEITTITQGIADLQARLQALLANDGGTTDEVGVQAFANTEAPKKRGRPFGSKNKPKGTQAVTTAPVTAQAAPVLSGKENLWREWAIAKNNIPRVVGGTFQYMSKRAKKPTTHQVVRVTEDGVYAVRVA